MKIKDTVRVLNHPDEMLPEWVEMFQYLGVLTDLTDGGPQVLQFRCPLRLTDPEARVKWAETVAEKMEKVGINAVPSFPWLMSDDMFPECSDCGSVLRNSTLTHDIIHENDCPRVG